MSAADGEDGNNDASKVDTVGLFLRAMVDREPGKRKVKASKAALIDLAQLDMGDSSDDSDFNVDEAKLNDDDDLSINSDPDGNDDSSTSGSSSGEEEEEENSEGEALPGVVARRGTDNPTLTVAELLERAKLRQEVECEKGYTRPNILVCAVCLGDNSDDTNEIVTCDGWCHVSVHEGCYGVSDTVSISSTVSSCSTEPWFCDACKAGVQNPPCELCPNLGYSIFKETEMGRWVHLVCALYVPGVAFSEVEKLSFPTLFEMAYSRWGSKVCSLCEDTRYAKTGVCIGCDAGMCRSYFHVTCAQREGLLSEVNHGEADQADPYYAHCRLHTDREVLRLRKRNWLTLQLHTKSANQGVISSKEQNRLDRKLAKYRDKYAQVKAQRPTPWYPTQKIPRSITTSASVFRTLLRKTELMGLSTEVHSAAEVASIGDVRKKWHIPPAFSVEFTCYYVDRLLRLKEMKKKLEELLAENSILALEESKMKERLQLAEQGNKAAAEENATLLAKSLELHNLLKGLAGRPLPLPPVVAAIHNPPAPVALSPMGTQTKSGTPGGRETRRIMTKAAAKMIADPLPAALDDNEAQHPPASFSSSSVLSSPPLRTVKSCSSTSPNKGRAAAASAAAVVTPLTAAAAVGAAAVGTKTDQDLPACSVCRQSTDPQLVIQCDTCTLHYHLCCLDPPLTRMPKKTKQMGWQCSDCCRSSDSEKVSEVDMSAPRRLRRIIKEPAKFSPSVAATAPAGAVTEQKTVHERSPPFTPPGSPNTSTPCGRPVKRKKSSDTPCARSRAAPQLAKRVKKMEDSSSGEVAENLGSNVCDCTEDRAVVEAGVEADTSVGEVLKKEEEERKLENLFGDPGTQAASRVRRTGPGKKVTGVSDIEKHELKLDKDEPMVIKSDFATPEKRSLTKSDYEVVTPTRGRKRKNFAAVTSGNVATIVGTVTTETSTVNQCSKDSEVCELDSKMLSKSTGKPCISSSATTFADSVSVIRNNSVGSCIARSEDLVAVSITTFRTSSDTLVDATSIIKTSASLGVAKVPNSFSAQQLARSVSSYAATGATNSELVAGSGDISMVAVSSPSAGITPASSASLGSNVTFLTNCVTASRMSADTYLSSNTYPSASLVSATGHLPSGAQLTPVSQLSALPVSIPTHPLDVSADSLPSVASLHSPTSESLQSHEEDIQPHSPRKEKRHRDGSKKKKKDRDRDKEKTGDKAEKRRKKHHHSYWDAQHQSSEMLAPLRLKIKPLPPRPPEAAEAFLPSTQGSVSITHCQLPTVSPYGGSSVPTTLTGAAPQTLSAPPQHVPPLMSFPVTQLGKSVSLNDSDGPAMGGTSSDSGGETIAPPGYPPLPPGYTLTQPLLPHTTENSSMGGRRNSDSGVGVVGAVALLSGITSSAPSVVPTSSDVAPAQSSSGVVAPVQSSGGVGRRKSDSGSNGAGAQQFSKCDVCGETGGVTNTVACDECHKAYHFNCLDPPLKKSPKRRGYSWFCEDCEPSK